MSRDRLAVIWQLFYSLKPAIMVMKIVGIISEEKR